MSKQMESVQIETALEALLLAAAIHTEQNPRQTQASPANDAANSLIAQLDWTPAQVIAHDLCVDPVGVSLRRGVRALAERLFEIGGNHAMADALDAILERHPEHQARMEAVADRQFSGIGNWWA